MTETTPPGTHHQATRERLRLLVQIEQWLEIPMIVLAFVWLVLLVVELVWGLSPFLDVAGTAIWIVFIIDFLIRFIVAPAKLRYLRRNALTVVSLVLPALRMFRLFRVLRLVRGARGLRLIKVVGSLNRGIRATRASMGRRGFGYVMILTVLVTVVGAAGMYAFERSVEDGRGFQSYGEALWWTAMLITTLGSEFWPRSAEGRVLCLLLGLYGFAVFGYITATFASLFIDHDAASRTGQIASAKSVRALEAEIRALRTALEKLPPR